MFRSGYDGDTTIFSPEGRLHQLEYAMQAVKLGTVAIGLKGTFHAILVCYNKTVSELADHQKKIISINNHVGVAFSGLIADAKILSSFLRLETLNYGYYHGTTMPINRLVNKLGAKMQISTQYYNRRPYGISMLIAGIDDAGPHIFQVCPSANYYDCKAMAIGGRSQSAITYLEKHLCKFECCSLEELIIHGLRALRSTLPNEIELNTKNVSIAVVGIDKDFELFNETDIGLYVVEPSENQCESLLDSEAPRAEHLRKESGDKHKPSDSSK